MPPDIQLEELPEEFSHYNDGLEEVDEEEEEEEEYDPPPVRRKPKPKRNLRSNNMAPKSAAAPPKKTKPYVVLDKFSKSFLMTSILYSTVFTILITTGGFDGIFNAAGRLFGQEDLTYYAKVFLLMGSMGLNGFSAFWLSKLAPIKEL